MTFSCSAVLRQRKGGHGGGKKETKGAGENGGDWSATQQSCIAVDAVETSSPVMGPTHVTSHVALKLSNQTTNPKTAVLNQGLENWPEPFLAPTRRLLILLTIMISFGVSGRRVILRHSHRLWGVSGKNLLVKSAPQPPSRACKHTILAMFIRRLHPVTSHLEFRPWVTIVAGCDLHRWFCSAVLFICISTV